MWRRYRRGQRAMSHCWFEVLREGKHHVVLRSLPKSGFSWCGMIKVAIVGATLRKMKFRRVVARQFRPPHRKSSHARKLGTTTEKKILLKNMIAWFCKMWHFFPDVSTVLRYIVRASGDLCIAELCNISWWFHNNTPGTTSILRPVVLMAVSSTDETELRATEVNMCHIRWMWLINTYARTASWLNVGFAIARAALK